MNKKIILEKIYLANVILYIPSIEDIIKIKFINKKCLDSTNIIRIYEKRPKYFNENKKIIPSNLFEIFPNIETIECNYNDLKN